MEEIDPILRACLVGHATRIALGLKYNGSAKDIWEKVEVGGVFYDINVYDGVLIGKAEVIGISVYGTEINIGREYVSFTISK